MKYTGEKKKKKKSIHKNDWQPSKHMKLNTMDLNHTRDEWSSVANFWSHTKTFPHFTSLNEK